MTLEATVQYTNEEQREKSKRPREEEDDYFGRMSPEQRRRFERFTGMIDTFCWGVSEEWPDDCDEAETAEQALEMIYALLKSIQEALPREEYDEDRDEEFNNIWCIEQRFYYGSIHFLMAKFNREFLGNKAKFEEIKKKVSESIAFSLECQAKADLAKAKANIEDF
jgi:predicted transcriptional regulator